MAHTADEEPSSAAPATQRAATGLATTPDGVDATEPLRMLFRDLRTSPRRAVRSARPRGGSRPYGPNELRRRGAPQLAGASSLDQLIHPLALLLWVAAALSLRHRGTPRAGRRDRRRDRAQRGVRVRAGAPGRAGGRGAAAPTCRSARSGACATGTAARSRPRDARPRRRHGDRRGRSHLRRRPAARRAARGRHCPTLTGESLPALRSATGRGPGRPAAAGARTSCSAGPPAPAARPRRVVVRTGMHTELGRIAALSAAGRRASRARSSGRCAGWPG